VVASASGTAPASSDSDAAPATASFSAGGRDFESADAAARGAAAEARVCVRVKTCGGCGRGQTFLFKTRVFVGWSMEPASLTCRRLRNPRRPVPKIAGRFLAKRARRFRDLFSNSRTEVPPEGCQVTDVGFAASTLGTADRSGPGASLAMPGPRRASRSLVPSRRASRPAVTRTGHTRMSGRACGRGAIPWGALSRTNIAGNGYGGDRTFTTGATTTRWPTKAEVASAATMFYGRTGSNEAGVLCSCGYDRRKSISGPAGPRYRAFDRYRVM